MGTKKSLQFKYARAYELMHAAYVQGCDVDKEKAIAQIMTSCFCERRKAIEVLRAQAISLGFEDDRIMGKSIWVHPKVAEKASMEKLEVSEQGAEYAEQTIC